MKMTSPDKYNLYWKTIPFGALRGYEEWYYPYLESGIYMLVLATNTGRYVGYYIGISKNIGRRWRIHLDDWFIRPKPGQRIPVDPDAFLKDPVAVINAEKFERVPQNGANPQRVKNQEKIMNQTWFAFADVHAQRGHLLENIEYVLHKTLKQHVGIMAKGWIGDTGHYCPYSRLSIYNHFSDRPPLKQTLPREIQFDPDHDIR